jgi:hypothetical protein
MTKIELTPDEVAMVRAFRMSNEIPINAILWYCTGLKDSAKLLYKLTDNDVAKDIASASIQKAASVNKLYNKYLKEEEGKC